MVGAVSKPLAGSHLNHRSFSLQARARFSFKQLRRKTSAPIPSKPIPDERHVFDDLTRSLQQDTSTAVKTTSPLLASLLPLPFAQRRRDIRERREGFEMRGKPPTPFAIRAHTLLPLDVAYEREDIRRRDSDDVCSEPSSVACLPQVGRVVTVQAGGLSHSPDRQTIRSPALSPSASQPARLCTIDSPPSVYSNSRSWIGDLSKLDPSIAAEDSESWSYDSLVAVYSSAGCCDEDFANDEAADVRRILDSLSSSSFDEESFMRMAENCVGW